jgi:hypothetical protein
MKEYNNSDGKLFTDKNQVSVGGINISRNSWMEQAKIHIIQMQKNMTPTPVLRISARGCCKTITEHTIHRTDNASAEKSEGDAPGLMAKIAQCSTTNKELTTKILPHRRKLSLPKLKCGGWDYKSCKIEHKVARQY